MRRCGVHTPSASIPTPLRPPLVSSLQVQPPGRAESSTARLQIPASLPVERTFGVASALPPGSILTGSVEIPKVAL